MIFRMLTFIMCFVWFDGFPFTHVPISLLYIICLILTYGLDLGRVKVDLLSALAVLCAVLLLVSTLE